MNPQRSPRGANPGTSAERNSSNRPALTPREREIVHWVAQGYSNKEIARKLMISEQTVKNHMRTIFDKVGVRDRLGLALYSVHVGLSGGDL